MIFGKYGPAGKPELPQWAWLWLPPLLVVAELGWRLLDEPSYRRIADSELGPIENVTLLILIPGIVAGLLLLFRYRSALPARWLVGWALLVTLGAVYFAGEEVSWGQHWFGWQTPESIQAVNDQQETNLHNVSSWLDQKPRLLLELWVLVGGILYQFWRPRHGIPADGSDWRPWFWPTAVLLPTSLLAILVKLPDRLDDLFGWGVPPPFDLRLSETQENYFALFLTLYLCSLYVRARDRQRARA